MWVVVVRWIRPNGRGWRRLSMREAGLGLESGGVDDGVRRLWALVRKAMEPEWRAWV